MAQTNFHNRDHHIDTDTDDSDSNSNSSRSGNLYFVRNDSTKKETRRRSTSHHLLMDAIEGSEEEKVPLPDYERLSQSMRLPEDMVQETDQKITLTHSQSHVQKPIARKLIDKVFKKDGEKEKGKEKEKEKEKEGDGADSPAAANKEKKKKSSWLPDPEKRWPIQGWS